MGRTTTPPAEHHLSKGFTTSDFFVLRTPQLPLEEFLALSESLSLPQALWDGGDLESVVATDRKLVRARLIKLLERTDIQEALWLASPEFFESLALWKKEPESTKGQKLERALYRYVARMTSRPTPFGLFAGCTVGRIGASTRLQLGPRTEYWRHSRLDMEYLFNLAEKISSDRTLQCQLPFRPNSSLYLAAGRYHHAQSYLANDVRCYRLIATEHTPYLAATLERASAGTTPVELAAALANDDPEVSLDEATEYIRQLIESQILVSDLAPPITGPEPIDNMVAQFEPASEPIAGTLRSISGLLRRLDEAGLGNKVSDYQQIADSVSKLPCGFKLDHLVQVDMMKTATDVTLDQRTVREILRGVEVLHALDRALQQDPLAQFKADFQERYQEQEVPLVLALDDEVGIGFERKDQPDAVPEPLLENIDFSAADEEPTVKAHRAELILLRKLQELDREQKTTLELDAKLLEALQTKNPLPLPDAFAVMLQIIGPASAKREKCSLFLQGVTGPSGAQLLGRFCPADEQLTMFVKGHLREEEEHKATEHAIYAEIVHLPEGRVGNVLCRPMLRAYEIPFLANSRAPLDHQIPITDLMVSIKNDRVTLRSQRLGREIIPRLTSAHGYQHDRNLKVYKFLCLLQTQGVAGNLSWDWGILEEASFLPRVVLGNLILAPARWRMGKEDIENLARTKDPDRLRRIDEWRRQQGIPRFALLAEADNQLLIDFENVLSVETLIEYIKNKNRTRLLEMLQEPQSLFASGPEGSFTHELVVPFVQTKPEEARKHNFNLPVPAIVERVERSFLPGTEWLFAKIYASPSFADRLLLEEIKPLAARVLAAEAADSWFFIRYGDPHSHLRLRFHGEPERLRTQVFPELSACLQVQTKQGRVWRVQFDTYERELERYGGPVGIRIAEQLFWHDSELVLELLSAISQQLTRTVRWHLAFTSVDQLLCGLGLDASTRRKLLNNMGKAQEKSFGLQHAYRQQLSEKFRNERQVLENLLNPNPEGRDLPTPAQSALAQFTEQLKTIRSDLESAQKVGKLSKPIDELAGSYVHMHLNRMFRSAANAQEMMLYDFLVRTYDSKMAQGK